MRKTTVYIDGFNFYYGAARRWQCKWVDLVSMVQHILPSNKITSVKLYTAMISERLGDSSAPIRQATYLRALRAHSKIEIILGHFLTHRKSMISAENTSIRIAVLSTEEKGTDVNLAADMVHDAHCNRFDVGILISNDSDFLRALDIVRNDVNKTVGVVNPQHRYQSRELAGVANFVKTMRRGDLVNHSCRSNYMTNMVRFVVPLVGDIFCSHQIRNTTSTNP